MKLLLSLAAAFKGGGPRVPLARPYGSPWSWGEIGANRPPDDHTRAVVCAYLENPVAHRAVRLVADGIGGAPLCLTDPALVALVTATSAGQPLLENAARSSGALVYDVANGGRVSTDQFDRLREELNSAFAGGGNAGRPLLLEGGFKWQSLSMSPADMDFTALKAARDIALTFGVPPMLLGLPGDSTYNNYKEANKALWRLTLLALAARLFAALGEGLRGWFPEARLAVDVDRVPALAEDRQALWTQVNGAAFLSDAEKRVLLGLPADLTAPPPCAAPEEVQP